MYARVFLTFRYYLDGPPCTYSHVPLELHMIILMMLAQGIVSSRKSFSMPDRSSAE
jgi:hypothetical protein